MGPPNAGRRNARRADNSPIGPGVEPGSGFRRVSVLRVCWWSGCGHVVEPVGEIAFGPGGYVCDEHQQVGGAVLGFGPREAEGVDDGIEGVDVGACVDGGGGGFIAGERCRFRNG